MKFYSTNKQSPVASLKEAVLTGLAPDGGLYMPTEIPVLPKSFFEKIHNLSFQEISFYVGKRLFSKDIPKNILEEMIYKAFDFPVILRNLHKGFNVLELFHGPTLAFKDFAARFMARLISYLAASSKRELTILVATSGDTGSAVANGFFNIEGISVIILYPSKKVSPIQEAQLCTIGGNVTALEIKGTFDDCQKLVKEAFVDEDLNKTMNLTSSNSINIARLFPQSFYYFYAFSQLGYEGQPLVFSVPSGNFGNLTGGLLAKKMGLPVHRFIAATNINDTVPRYFKNGKYIPRSSKTTISNAMDVGNPSNFARILALYDSNYKKIRKDICSFSFSDSRTTSAILEVYKKYNYILDPHGAVAYLGLKKYYNLESKPAQGIFIESAHPAKFCGTIEDILKINIDIPERLKASLDKEKKSIILSNSFLEFKDFLLAHQVK